MALAEENDNRSLLVAAVGDGRQLLVLSGLLLVLSGFFVIFQALTGHLLPHDEAYLGMTVEELGRFADGRIVDFMIHDRVAFGGALAGLGVIYMWLAEFPMKVSEGWAWWTYASSSAVGFLSFLTFLSYGYLDTWHGLGTLLVLPMMASGLWLTKRTAQPFSWRQWDPSRWSPRLSSRSYVAGNVCLLLTGLGLLTAGLIIVAGGATRVFVPEDLGFIGLSAAELQTINPRLVPLIAHDRAAFGGAMVPMGIVVASTVVYGRPSPSRWQVIAVAGTIGFATAIGVHFYVDYLKWSHVVPAYAAAAVFAVGLVATYRVSHNR